MLRSTLTSAADATDRNRAEVEFERFIPVLLFLSVENEASTALDAITVFINVEVFWQVVSWAVCLLTYITPYGTVWHHWLVIRITLPPFIELSILTDIRVMDERNIPE
jgi:hypothetical protein